MLRPALVPEPLWGVSASNLLTRKQWQTIRTEMLQRDEHRCVYCGQQQEKGLICHEVWTYDEDTRVATLSAMSIVCRACSGVLHIGLTAKRGYKGQALQHMATTNGTTFRGS